MADGLFHPPRPRPLPALVSLLRVLWRGDGDLLSLVPAQAYRKPMCELGKTRRSILMVSDPVLAHRIMTDDLDLFPKSDLMVEALKPLVGDCIFVSGGATWERQRKMINPAFTHMRVSIAFGAMAAAVQESVAHLDEVAARGERVSLDLLTSHLTADAPQEPAVLAACARIRELLGMLVDEHGQGRSEDIATAVRCAHDTAGRAFTREELIDQLGVMFLAGHETTASGLTWILYLMSVMPAVRERMRAEVRAVAGDEPVGFEHVKEMTYIRNVFRETLRLYPPITFIPRVAAEKTRIGNRRVRKGALIMISPWVMQRHQLLWKNPDAFDPDRFSAEREGELHEWSYIPFGQGPRICVGQAFAMTEAVLVLAELVRRYDFAPVDAGAIRPVARLTTRPAQQVFCTVTRAAR